MTSRYTDNGDLESKLKIRRYFLERYHRAQPPRVFDACQGEGLIWNAIRREFEVASYLGVDLKPKPGRLKIDSVRFLSQIGWAFDVIDVDVYGEPWKHWDVIQRFAPVGDLTVFLTMGVRNVQNLSHDALLSLGIPFRIPVSMHRVLVPELIRTRIFGTHDRVRVTEVVEIPNGRSNARYFGIRAKIL